MKNFLECVKCSTGKIKITGLKHTEEKVGVRLGCVCGASEVFSIPSKDFMCWVATPEITEAMKIYNKPKKKESGQRSLW